MDVFHSQFNYIMIKFINYSLLTKKLNDFYFETVILKNFRNFFFHFMSTSEKTETIAIE